MKLNYFNFKRLNNRILMTNDFGKYVFVTEEELKLVITGHMSSESDLYKRLTESGMIYDQTDLEFSEHSRYLIREAKSHVETATSLHIFVVTTACNMRCVYCQANNGLVQPCLYMDEETAEKAVDIALQSPKRLLTFEFQGGEPLLNFSIIKHIVEYTEARKGDHEIYYNVVTNLTLLTDEMLLFFKEYRFGISTSLDGPPQVNDCNRKFADSSGTYRTVMKSIEKIRSAGMQVGAIQTTTRNSLVSPEAVVRTYAELGFESIFIRPLTPLGKAMVDWNQIGYTAEEFLCFYERAFEELIRVNCEGRYMREAHASIFLRRIDGQRMNYMELRSPCGAGIGQLAYYADGHVFTCDEGRMLYEMGEDAFCLGTVFRDTYTDLIRNPVCKAACAASVLESIPTCCDCVYQPYCGTCPVVNYASFGDVIEKSPGSYRCRIYAGIQDIIFEKILENNPQTVHILKSWSN